MAGGREGRWRGGGRGRGRGREREGEGGREGEGEGEGEYINSISTVHHMSQTECVQAPPTCVACCIDPCSHGTTLKGQRGRMMEIVHASF